MDTPNDDSWLPNIPDHVYQGDQPAQAAPKHANVRQLRQLDQIAAELENAPVAGVPDHSGPDDPGPHAPPPEDDGRGDWGPDDAPPPPDGGGGRPFGEIWDGCPVRPLGTSNGVFHYLNGLGEHVELTKHAAQDIMAAFNRHIPALCFAFPKYVQGKDGTPTRKLQHFDHQLAAVAMLQACGERGVFSPFGRVRGPGAWADDDGKLIYHAGDEVLIGGQWCPPGVYADKIYPATGKIPRPAVELKGNPAEDVLAKLGTWRWRRPAIDPVVALGLTCAQMMGGALEWRPVGWWTGDAATGKSTLQKLMSHLHGGEAGLLKAEDTSEAGIRSVVGQSTLPVAVDELEPDKDNPRKVKAVIELARRAASGGVVFRGSADQKGHQSMARSAFVFSSILIPPMPAQDRSRLIQLDLDRIPDGAPKLPMDPRTLRKLGAGIKRALIDRWPTWAERLELWRAALARHGQTGRGSDNYATVLAMADMALHEALPTEEVTEAWAAKLGKSVTDDSVDIGSNADDMITWLLGQEYDVYRSGEKYVVAQWLMTAASLPGAPDGILGQQAPAAQDARRKAANEKLCKAGIRVEGVGQKASLIIANNPLPQLAKLFDGSEWAGGVWTQAARRLPGADVRPTMSFAGQKSRATAIPFKAIPGLFAFPTDRVDDLAAHTPSPAQMPPDMDDYA